MKKERLFKKEYAHELLRVAELDLEAGRALHSLNHPRAENILFHAQQAIEKSLKAVEKSLKAVLCWRGQTLPMVHELALISERLENISPVPRKDELDDLTQFATIRRYEEGVFVLTFEEITEALMLASEILVWANKETALK